MQKTLHNKYLKELLKISYERAISSTLRLGAKGIKVTVSGRLVGKKLHEQNGWRRLDTLHTLRADVDYAEAEAETTYGIIGVKVWIYKGCSFPKKI